MSSAGTRRRHHELPYPAAPARARHASPYPGPPPPGPTRVRSAHQAAVASPSPIARPTREQHAEDALRAIAQAAEKESPARPLVALSRLPELDAYRMLLLAAALSAIALPLLLLPNWYAADLGPEFTAEGVSGWEVGASAQAIAWLGFGALVAIAISAGAAPASDGERISAALAAAALVTAAAITWYRVAVVPEPADLFVREPWLWVAALITTLGAAATVGYAAMARATEIERLEAVRTGA